jgi:hypothetical protein
VWAYIDQTQQRNSGQSGAMTASNLNDCFPKTRLRVNSRSTGSSPYRRLVMAIAEEKGNVLIP